MRFHLQPLIVLALMLSMGCSIIDHFNLKKDRDIEFSKNGNEKFNIKANCYHNSIEILIQSYEDRPIDLDVNNFIVVDDPENGLKLESYFHYEKSNSTWPDDSFTYSPQVTLKPGSLLKVNYRMTEKLKNKEYVFKLQKPFVNQPKITCVYKK